MTEYKIVDSVYHNILNYFKAISLYSQYIIVSLMKIRDSNMQEQDSELQERMLNMGIIQQVNDIFEKLSGKKEPKNVESYKFIILNLGEEDAKNI